MKKLVIFGLGLGLSALSALPTHSDPASETLRIQLERLSERKNALLQQIKDLERTRGPSGTRALVPSVMNGRLSLESGVALSTSDIDNATTLYLVPHQGHSLALYNTGSSSWRLYSFSQIGLSLGTLTDAKNYDVFVHDSSGTLTLSLVAWASDVLRTSDLVSQDGVYVKSGAANYRYLGTLRTTSTTTTSDSKTKRFLWNYYNRVSRPLLATDSSDYWTNSGPGMVVVYEPAHSTLSNSLQFVLGLDEGVLRAQAYSNPYFQNGACGAATGIGLDTYFPVEYPLGVSTLHYNCAPIEYYYTSMHRARYFGYPGKGYHYLAWLQEEALEYMGDNGSIYVQTGITGIIDG